MKLNKFDRELILGKIKTLTNDRESRINLRRNFQRKDLEPAVIEFDTGRDKLKFNSEELAILRKKKNAAQAMVNSCDIEIELLDENIERLEKILIDNKF